MPQGSGQTRSTGPTDGTPGKLSTGIVLALAVLLGSAALYGALGGLTVRTHVVPTPQFQSPAPSASVRPQGIGSVVATIPVGYYPISLAFDQTDNKMFVANQGQATTADPGNLSVINPTTNTVSSWLPLPTIPSYGGSGPDSLAYDSANGDLYIVDANNFHVSVLNAATYANLSFIDFTKSAGNSGSLALDTTTGTLFMVSYDNQSMYTISTSTNTATGQFYTETANANLLQLPQKECFDPANGDLYISQMNALGNSIPSDIVVDSASSELFVTNFTTPTNFGGCVYDPTNGHVYVAGGNQIYVINGATNTLLSNISFASQVGTTNIAYDSANGYLYVSDYNTNAVSVINGSTDQVLGSIAVGSEPDAIAYDNTNGDIYVGNDMGGNSPGTISVINPAGGSSGGPVITSFTASPATVSPGQATVLSVSVTGGTTPYSYAFTGLPSDCTSQNLASLPCTSSLPGTYSVTVTVTDNSGKTTTGTASFTVSAPSGYPAITSFTVTPATVSTGTATTFSVSVTGGASPYTYAYTGLPSGCVSSSTAALPCTPTSSGNYSVQVTVTDANHHSISATTKLTVTGGSPTGSGSGGGNGNGWILWVVVGVVVVAAVAGGLLYFLKLKKPKAPPPTPYNAQPQPYGQAPGYGSPPPP